MRKANSAPILFAGLIVAGFMAVPLLNLATPVFAAALMVHLHKAIAQQYPDPAQASQVRRAA